jgi:hypothetical protein
VRNLNSDIKAIADTEGVENGVLRRIFGFKMDKIIRGWKKLHNEKLHK